MTVAALQALALRECLSNGQQDLQRRFFRAAAKPTRLACQMAVGGGALPVNKTARRLPAALRPVRDLDDPRDFPVQLCDTGDPIRSVSPKGFAQEENSPSRRETDEPEDARAAAPNGV